MKLQTDLNNINKRISHIETEIAYCQQNINDPIYIALLEKRLKELNVAKDSLQVTIADCISLYELYDRLTSKH